MPAVSTITLTENANNHVFEPITVSAKETVLTTKVANTPLGEMILTLGFQPYNGNRDTDIVTVKLEMPIELGNATDGYYVNDKVIGSCKITLPKAVSSLNRDKFAELMGSAFSNAIIQGYQDRDPFWG